MYSNYIKYIPKKKPNQPKININIVYTNSPLVVICIGLFSTTYEIKQVVNIWTKIKAVIIQNKEIITSDILTPVINIILAYLYFKTKHLKVIILVQKVQTPADIDRHRIPSNLADNIMLTPNKLGQ